jgi:hypothetical protein
MTKLLQKAFDEVSKLPEAAARVQGRYRRSDRCLLPISYERKRRRSPLGGEDDRRFGLIRRCCYRGLRLSNQRPNNAAAIAPATCPPINSGTLLGEIPANVSVIARAKVTAGFANDVEEVNQ